MTQTATVVTEEIDSARAGSDLGSQIRRAFDGAVPDAVVVFASARHWDYATLLGSLAETCGTRTIVGSSSAGEFSDRISKEGAVSALALKSNTMQFATAMAENLSAEPEQAARSLARQFRGTDEANVFPYRSALVMTDALAGHTDAAVEELTVSTGGNYRFFGGGAGDDGRFHRTHVFSGLEARSDAIVALEILSERPLGVGVSHGWMPASAGLRVTEVTGMRLIGLNGAPAIQAFEDHATATQQQLDRGNPLPFFLHNIIGIETADRHRLRVPLGVNEDGSINCAAAIPAGAIVRIMKTTHSSAILAAEQATRAALEGIGDAKPGAALVFDCVATRLRLGHEFSSELKACAAILQPAGFVGCNTYGQIARAEGQFGGFHNCTAVVCVIPA